MIVKICGVTTVEAALAAIDAGADMIGLNFHPPSVRYIEPALATRISKTIGQVASHVVRVGIFVNTAPRLVAALLDQCELDLAQLSGDEPSGDLAALNGRALKAIRTTDSQDASVQALRYARSNSPALLVDAAASGQYGGTGHRADWEVAAELARKYPLLLAGGLTPANVAEAIAAVHPWGVDVASGVESAPGIKDARKLTVFVRVAKELTITNYE